MVLVYQQYIEKDLSGDDRFLFDNLCRNKRSHATAILDLRMLRV